MQTRQPLQYFAFHSTSSSAALSCQQASGQKTTQFMQRLQISWLITGRHSRQLPVIIIGCSPTGAGVTQPNGTALSLGTLNMVVSSPVRALVERLDHGGLVTLEEAVLVLHHAGQALELDEAGGAGHRAEQRSRDAGS